MSRAIKFKSQESIHEQNDNINKKWNKEAAKIKAYKYLILKVTKGI